MFTILKNQLSKKKLQQKKDNALLKEKCENLIMINYEVHPALLMPYLPIGVQLDYFKEKPW